MKLKPMQIAMLLGLASMLALGVLMFYQQARTHTLRLAAGDRGGATFDYATALAAVVAEHEPQIRIELVETSGSADNMSLLQDHQVDLAIAQSDVTPASAARTIAYLYPQLFQLAAADSSGIASVPDLRGKRVGTPPAGGGSHNSFLRLMAHYGLSGTDLEVRPMLSADLAGAFARGEVDAVFVADVVGDERMTAVLRGGQAHLVPIEGEAMHLAMPYVEPLTVPRGAMLANPPMPAAELVTAGIQTGLLAHKETDAEIVRKVTAVLFDYTYELTQYTPLAGAVKTPAEVKSMGAPVAPGAQAYYDREKPSFVQQHTDLIGLGITAGSLLISFLFSLRARLQQRKKSRADRYNTEIVRLVEQVDRTTDRKQLEAARSKLLAMFKSVIDDLDQDRLTADSVQSFAMTWEIANATVRHRELVLSMGMSARALPW